MFGLLTTIAGGISAFSKINEARKNGEYIICPHCGDEMDVSFGCNETIGGSEGYKCEQHVDIRCNTPGCPNNLWNFEKIRNNQDFQTMKFDTPEDRDRYFIQIKAKVKILRIRDHKDSFKESTKRKGKVCQCDICNEEIQEGSKNMVQPSAKLGFRCYERAHYIHLSCWKHHILGENIQ